MPVELGFILQRLAAMAEEDAALRDQAAVEGRVRAGLRLARRRDRQALRGRRQRREGPDRRHPAGVRRPDRRRVRGRSARRSSTRRRTRRLGRRLRDCGYVPMVELLRFLEATRLHVLHRLRRQPRLHARVRRRALRRSRPSASSAARTASSYTRRRARRLAPLPRAARRLRRRPGQAGADLEPDRPPADRRGRQLERRRSDAALRRRQRSRRRCACSSSTTTASASSTTPRGRQALEQATRAAGRSSASRTTGPPSSASDGRMTAIPRVEVAPWVRGYDRVWLAKDLVGGLRSTTPSPCSRAHLRSRSWCSSRRSPSPQRAPQRSRRSTTTRSFSRAAQRARRCVFRAMPSAGGFSQTAIHRAVRCEDAAERARHGRARRGMCALPRRGARRPAGGDARLHGRRRRARPDRPRGVRPVLAAQPPRVLGRSGHRRRRASVRAAARRADRRALTLVLVLVELDRMGITELQPTVGGGDVEAAGQGTQPVPGLLVPSRTARSTRPTSARSAGRCCTPSTLDPAPRSSCSTRRRSRR